MILTSVLFVTLAAAASIEGLLEERAENKLCPIVKAAVTVLKQEAPATTYCSSYLKISDVQAATVVTEITTTATVTSGTATTDGFICPTTSAAGAVIIKNINKIRSPAVPAGKQPAVVKPAGLSRYQPGKALSSACSCLSITAATTTATTTVATVATVPSAYVPSCQGESITYTYAKNGKGGGLHVNIDYAYQDSRCGASSTIPSRALGAYEGTTLCEAARKCAEAMATEELSLNGKTFFNIMSVDGTWLCRELVNPVYRGGWQRDMDVRESLVYAIRWNYQ